MIDGRRSASLEHGLTEAEAEARRERGLGNVAPARTGRSYREIVVENVFTFINLSLFGLGLTLVLIGRPRDGLVSTGVITLNVLVSVVQEVRAKWALDRIALLAQPKARVIREGHAREVAPEELVLEDVLEVGPGDQIVVDGRVLEGDEVAVDESLLTGESEHVRKRAGDAVYSGSFCVSGRGRYAAERVGARSLAGQITAGARAFRRTLTPLQRGINQVIRLVLLIVVYVEFLLLVRALLTNTDLAGNVQNATVVAGLVPNGLFLSISVAYALAAVRIARQGVLVQQANAIESLSNVEVLCLDKTGTLTANRLHVEALVPLAPDLTTEDLGRLLGAVAASGSARNKTAEALARAFGGHARGVRFEAPFSSERRWSAVELEGDGGRQSQGEEPSPSPLPGGRGTDVGPSPTAGASGTDAGPSPTAGASGTDVGPSPTAGASGTDAGPSPTAGASGTDMGPSPSAVPGASGTDVSLPSWAVPGASGREAGRAAVAGGEAPAGGEGGEDGPFPWDGGVFVLGAPDALLGSLAVDDGAASAAAIDDRVRGMAERGLRVLLLLRASSRPVVDAAGGATLPEGCAALGLVGLADELRPEAREALAAFQKAGVETKVISGDDPDTVAALVRQAGLDSRLALISGGELEDLDDTAFAAAARDHAVFGRIRPQQKERLMHALRAGGAYVAMIGDGVNDVLSLKAADLGIAMQSGSQAARGVADLVLLNDSFEALVPAVAEGQRIVNGMVHILQLFLTRISTVGVVILSALVAGEFPLALRQASLVTLFSVGVPTVFLALWAEPGPMPKASIPSRVAHFVLPPVLITGAVSLLLFYGMLLLNLVQAGGLQRRLTDAELGPLFAAHMPVAQTGLATFLVFSGLLLVVFAAPPTPWWAGAEQVTSDVRPAALAAVLGAVFVAMSLTRPLASLFALSPLDWTEAGLVAAALVVWLVAVRWAWRLRNEGGSWELRGAVGN